MTTKQMQRRNENIVRNMTMKLFLFGLVLLICKAPVLSQEQDTDIRCEIGGLDFNLSQHDPGYLINFGSFSLFADGEKSKEEEGAVGIAKFYQLPRTKLILSIGVGYNPNGETPSDPQLMVMMILGKKKAPIYSSDFGFDEKMMKELVTATTAGYPIEAFDKGREGWFGITFLGKKKPVPIMMRCKKVKKASK